MAVPERAWGYKFVPKKNATPDEVMAVLAILMRLVTNNPTLAVGPRKEIDELPVILRRHFERQKM